MIKRLLCGVLLLVYALTVVLLVDFQKNRPIAVKLGYLPHSQILKVASGEHHTTVAGTLVMRLLFYFGTILQKLEEDVIVPPEFLNMYRYIQSIVAIDPYNMDSYYFAQAAFTWELGRIREVNRILEKGMLVRTWDYMLPFYLGFNHAYFLKDYAAGAKYMKIAAERSGNPFYTKLAARYFYESEQSSLGLAFLDAMILSTKDKAVRKSYELRRQVLLATQSISQARDAYLKRYGSLPDSLEALVDDGLLPFLPEDPYGGTFYLERDGQVHTTSKLVELKPAEAESGGHESN